MKKRYIAMACVALGITLLTTGCKKEEDKDTFNLNAVIEEVKGTQKVHMEGFLPVWDNNDAIRVNNENCTVSITGTGANRKNSIAKQEEERTYCAFYPASYLDANTNITNHSGIWINLPQRQVYSKNNSNEQIVRMPMIAYSGNYSTDLHFKNLCSVLKVTVTNTTGHDFTLDSIQVKCDNNNSKLWGRCSVSVDNNDYTNIASPAGISYFTSGGKVVTLCGAGNTSMNETFTANASPKTFYIVVPTVSENSKDTFRIRLCIEEGFLFNMKTNGKVSIARNKLISLPFSAEDFEQPIDVIVGPFSVSATTKVSFSTGNLWYDKTTQKYKFEAAQWAYTPIVSPNTFANETHISHFWWHVNASRSYDYRFPGNPQLKDVIFTNKPGDVHMANPNFEVEGVKGKFRTLSVVEWGYLIEDRNTRFSKVLSTIATISVGNGLYMDGFIILPDTSNANLSNLTTIDAINAWGAAFLPCAGGRQDANPDITYNDYLYGPMGNKWGVYWSSLCKDDVAKAWDFSFTTHLWSATGSPYYNCYGEGSRNVARALRLVCKYAGN